MVFKRNRPHATLRRLDGDLNHVLRAVNKIWVGMNFWQSKAHLAIVDAGRLAKNMSKVAPRLAVANIPNAIM
jgi:hypothetical protein